MEEVISISKNEHCGEPDDVGPTSDMMPIDNMGPSGCPIGATGFEAHVDRMLVERSKLQEKIAKLDVFISGNKYKMLRQVQQDLLVAQYNAMLTYLGILEMRLKVEGVKL